MANFIRGVVFLFLAAGTSLALAQVQAQFQYRAVGGAFIELAEGFVIPDSDEAKEATAATDAADADPELTSGRTEKINALQFDRRPSTILKVWNEPPPEAPKTETEAADSTADQADESTEGPVKEAVADQPKENAADSTDEPAGDTIVNENETEAEGETADSEEESPTTEETNSDSEAGEEDDTASTSPEDQAAAAEDAAAKEAERKKKLAADLELFDYQLKLLQRNVTLGNWPEVKTYLASLKDSESKAIYDRLLDNLRSDPNPQAQANPGILQQLILNGADTATLQQAISASGSGAGAAYAEKHLVAMPDLVELLLASPYELDDTAFQKLGTILRLAVATGHDPQLLLDQVAKVTSETEESPVTQRQIARLLHAGSQTQRIGEFLPSLDEARDTHDAQALNLLAEHYLTMHQKEKKPALLEQSWHATQAVLEIDEAAVVHAEDNASETEDASDKNSAEAQASDDKNVAAEAETGETAKEKEQTPKEKLAAEQKAALQRAVKLAPRLPEELGAAWLERTFTQKVERAQAILAAIGDVVSKNLQSHPYDADFRLKSLELQHAAFEALLQGSPEHAAQWSDVTTILAVAWLKEAEASYKLTHDSYQRPGWQRDSYGNYFYVDNPNEAMMYVDGSRLQPVKLDKLLDVAPGEQWLALVEKGLRPQFSIILARLHLKAGSEEDAFPIIEQLATTHGQQAHDLAEEFVRVWTSNHNPNQGNQRSSFLYYYGYEQRASRIPLTRSKQQRNLEELAELVGRLKALPIESIDEQLLTQAFTTAHSSAEVYQLEAIESVFGAMDQLEPRTIAELIQQMRGNLATVWQMPDVQKENSTNRKQQDIQLEVLRGYDTAKAVLTKALQAYPNDWALMLAEAAVMHDENEYYQQLEDSSEFVPRRNAALERFRQAAEAYVQAAAELPEDKHSQLPFEQWFYASLGAVDLGRIKAEHVSVLSQPPQIREVMLQLPGETAEQHMSQFANNLFSNVSNAKPELKFRYLRNGFEIVGDHPLAREARKLLEYYEDLVTEIKLQTVVDGSTDVGHDQPFGVFVNLVHTKEIEREAGGFGKYLQNQNQGGYYYYNFGRPLEDYRDKFQLTVDQALGEHFEVLSVTFQDPKVNSKALPQPGWRMTPYAYLLLKAKGPEVDTIAPVRVDFDFLDTSGYAVLPVESPAVPIDSSGESAPARPVEKIEIVQTLDERQSAEGKLLLEVRVKARGLVPALEELVDLSPEGFEVVNIEDAGVSVNQFDDTAMENSVSSERLWTVSLAANTSAEKMPEKFQFAEPILDTEEVIYQRYDDADLVTVEPEIDLQGSYAETDYSWVLALVIGLGVLVAVGLALRSLRRPAATTKPHSYTLPDPLTPFTVMTMLEDIEHNNGLSTNEKAELQTCIRELEQHYFAQQQEANPDLESIAGYWATRAT